MPVQNEITVMDGERKIIVKPLNAVEKMRIYKVLPAGAESKLLYLALIFTAASVRSIDGVPMPGGTLEAYEMTVGKLDDSGVDAVQAALSPAPSPDAVPMEIAAGNLQSGTISDAAHT